MQIQRIFNENNNLDLEKILSDIIYQQLDMYIKEKYNSFIVDNATSSNNRKEMY